MKCHYREVIISSHSLLLAPCELSQYKSREIESQWWNQMGKKKNQVWFVNSEETEAKIIWRPEWELQWRSILKQKEIRKSTRELPFEKRTKQKRNKKLSGLSLELHRNLIHFIKLQNPMKEKQSWLLLFHFFSPLLDLFQTNQPRKNISFLKSP